jgi:hypothetical protein
MTDDQIRIAIAEWCGWKWKPSNITAFGASHPLGALGAWYDPHGNKSLTGPPYYHNDLNAVHEAEKMLTGFEQKRKYRDALICAVGLNPEYWCRKEFTPSEEYLRVACATARQRCEALLKTVGLWKE